MASTGLSGLYCARGEISAFRPCGLRLSPKPAATWPESCRSSYAQPKFLDGSMTLGEVMQAASAFTIVQGAFNWLVDNYPRLSDWTASARRVASLQVSLDELERAEGRCRPNQSPRAKGAALRLRNLSVTLDDRH